MVVPRHLGCTTDFFSMTLASLIHPFLLVFFSFPCLHLVCVPDDLAVVIGGQLPEILHFLCRSMASVLHFLFSLHWSRRSVTLVAFARSILGGDPPRVLGVSFPKIPLFFLFAILNRLQDKSIRLN